MSRFINILYWFFWAIGILVFSILIYRVVAIEDNSLYISAVAILISAFLASLSMIKSIQNSKLIEDNKIQKEKGTLLLRFEYLLIVLLHQINGFNSQFPTFINRVVKLNKKDVHCNEYLSLPNDFFFSTLIETNNQFSSIRKELESQDLYKYIESGNRMLLVELCIKLSEFESLLNLIIHSKSTSESILDNFNKNIKKLTSSINQLIELQKLDIEKNHPSESLYTMDEYSNFYKKESDDIGRTKDE